MRLWHLWLIEYLPLELLKGQWEQLNDIYVNKPNDILIKFCYDYSQEDLLIYSNVVIKEMLERKIKVNFDVYREFFKGVPLRSSKFGMPPCYDYKMNHRYLRQCLYALQELHDCGGIKEDEWKPLYKEFIEDRKLIES